MRHRLSTLMIALAIVPPILGFLFVPRTSKCRPVDAARSNIMMLQDAVQFYALDVGQLPADLDALLVPPSDLPNRSKWGGPYLKNPLPLDPWGQPYRYEIRDGIQGIFRVWSPGPDGRSRTADDVFVDDDGT